MDIQIARNLKRIYLEEDDEFELKQSTKNKLKLFRLLALLKYDEASIKNKFF